jgi:hypothetical protein
VRQRRQGRRREEREGTNRATGSFLLPLFQRLEFRLFLLFYPPLFVLDWFVRRAQPHYIHLLSSKHPHLPPLPLEKKYLFRKLLILDLVS